MHLSLVRVRTQILFEVQASATDVPCRRQYVPPQVFSHADKKFSSFPVIQARDDVRTVTSTLMPFQSIRTDSGLMSQITAPAIDQTSVKRGPGSENDYQSFPSKKPKRTLAKKTDDFPKRVSEANEKADAHPVSPSLTLSDLTLVCADCLPPWLGLTCFVIRNPPKHCEHYCYLTAR